MRQLFTRKPFFPAFPCPKLLNYHGQSQKKPPKRLFLAQIPKNAHLRSLVKGFDAGAFLFFKSVL
jgi:hypothetical protein